MITKISTLLLAVFLCASFSACVTPGGRINYNVQEPSVENSQKNQTSMFYGAYRDDLNFKAIAVEDNDGVRIVIMNDLGLKIQDMKIRKDGVTDVYFYISYMPKYVVGQFTDFFKELFISDNKENIKTEDGKIYYLSHGKPVLWVTKI